MTLEFALAVLESLKTIAAVVSILAFVACAFLLLLRWIEFAPNSWDSELCAEEKRAVGRKLLRATTRLGVVAFASLLVALVPSLDDLWRVRVALIKYQLASPESVKAGAEEIARVAKKLECKYLGGCEKEADE